MRVRYRCHASVRRACPCLKMPWKNTAEAIAAGVDRGMVGTIEKLIAEQSRAQLATAAISHRR